MTEREDSEQTDHGGISPELLHLLTTVGQSFERGDARNWASPEMEITDEQAREQVRRILAEQLFDRMPPDAPGIPFLLGAIAVQEIFGTLAPAEQTLEDAIKHRLDDHDTFQAVRFLAELTPDETSPALSRFKTFFMTGVVREPKKPSGPSPSRDAHRNMIMVSQIKQLEKVGIEPTRNSATKEKRSGCDVVAGVMSELGHNISYSAVERIWKMREQLPQLTLLSDLLYKELTGSQDPVQPSD